MSNLFFPNGRKFVSITVHKRPGSLNPQLTLNYIKIPSHLLSSINASSDIDSEILPRLFTKFATKTDKGTDLGQFISKIIIEAHKDKILADNNSDGKGATFHSAYQSINQQITEIL